MYEEGKGTIVPYKNVPQLRQTYSELEESKGYPDLKVKGNYYYDTSKCCISYPWRYWKKYVIGTRTPLAYRRFYCKELLQTPYHWPWIMNGDGDVYFMSEKATENDWKKWSQVTLRHAAGCSEYTKMN